MRAQFEKLMPVVGRSFRVDERRSARFGAPWHFHPEIELTYILSSRGRRFVGDSIEPFALGDLVLLGPNLPHFWHNDAPMGRRGSELAHSIVVQFRSDFMGAEFWATPELARVRRLIERAGRGLSFSASRLPRAVEKLIALPRLQGVAALVQLLSMLDELAGVRARPLASETYSPRLDLRSEARVARAYAFMLGRFRDPITLEQIARAASMTPAAFSRFFKRSTGRNVSVVLNELRIGHAAQQLQSGDSGVAEIAYASGFPTLSNFNRRFREQMKRSPREFRRDFRTAAVAGD